MWWPFCCGRAYYCGHAGILGWGLVRMTARPCLAWRLRVTGGQGNVPLWLAVWQGVLGMLLSHWWVGWVPDYLAVSSSSHFGWPQKYFSIYSECVSLLSLSLTLFRCAFHSDVILIRWRSYFQGDQEWCICKTDLVFNSHNAVNIFFEVIRILTILHSDSFGTSQW